ncbi:hypothetical protein GCN74_25560 [Janthinobacterium sp. FT14W]|uniref:hypothetical protein n=1 Tax=Janthinobacterium sp. FT14W TaxID=2654253 RepID=UPI001263F4A8|nr:hypothetical protein [Janthinobacterium sp. FT14W]KAB8052931.1 hypothetical protein GCN74_25560 [Janthinobacterium sp. FT14W]
MKAAMINRYDELSNLFRRAGCGAVLLVILSACGGGTATPPVPPVDTPRYLLGGTVSGLLPGASVVLMNGTDKVTVTANGAFSFAGKLAAGASYDGKVDSTSAGLGCSIAHGTATMGNADVSALTVRCLPVVLAGVQEKIQLVAGMVGDAAGNYYIADAGNHVIHKLGTDGTLSVYAGVMGKEGGDDGPVSGATLSFTAGTRLAIDRQANIFLSDYCHAVLRKITPAGVVSTVAGQRRSSCETDDLEAASAYVDGQGAQARFGLPGSLIADANGDVLLVDTHKNAIRRVTASGVVSTLPWTYAPMPEVHSDFQRVGRLAIDPAGNVYFSDITGTYVFRIQNGIAVKVAGNRSQAGSVDGIGGAASFFRIRGMRFNRDGELLLVDGASIRKVQADGRVTTLLGAGVFDANGQDAGFQQLSEMVLEPSGAMVVYDLGRHMLRRLDQAGKLSTLPALPGHIGLVDGVGAAARLTLGYARAVVADVAGNVYLADDVNKVIRRVTPDGTVSIFAGMAGQGGSVNGVRGTATLQGPVAMAFDREGNLYFADQYHGMPRLVLRKINKQGEVSSIAELPVSYGTRFALAVDQQDNVYWVNNAGDGIYRRAPGGEFSLFVPYENAMKALNGKTGTRDYISAASLAVDRHGALYFEDVQHHVIFKVAQNGDVSHFAGTPLQRGGKDGPPGTGSLSSSDYFPLMIDANDKLYTGSQGAIRRIDTAGVISTLQLGWGSPVLSTFAIGNGVLYGFTAQALIQAPLP